MSRDRLAQMQAEKRRAQGYAPQQPGAPGSPTSGGADAAMYPVGGAAQAGSPPMQQIPQGGAATYGGMPQSAVDPNRTALLGNRAQQQPSYQGQAGPEGAYGAPIQQGAYGAPVQQVAYGAPVQQGAYGAPGQLQAGYGAPGPGQGGYEMQQMQGGPVGAGVGAYGNGAPSAGPGSSMQEFFGEIDLISNSLQQLKSNITQINTLHTTVLNSATNEQRQEQASRDLEQMTADTSRLTNSTKLRIKNLSELTDKQASTLQPGELNTRRMQVAAQKKKFMDLIQEYREVEAKSRDKYRQRMERQYKIVKPDATPEEIKHAIETDQGSQVFANALTQSTRYADARNAYREVQERHEDIKRIAQTMQELQQLFNDMAMLVERQDEQIQTIEATANDVETNMQAANVQIDKGVKSARKARRKRWICFWILVIIIIVVAIAVTLSVLKNQGKL